MTTHGSLTRSWAGGTSTFRLGLDEIEQLERKTDKSIFVLLAAATASVPFLRVAEMLEVIRIALIGGGLDPASALKEASFQVDRRPLLETMELCADILTAAIQRLEGTLPGESRQPDHPHG